MVKITSVYWLCNISDNIYVCISGHIYQISDIKYVYNILDCVCMHMCITVIYTTGRQSIVRLSSFGDWPGLESSLSTRKVCAPSSPYTY